MDFQGLWGQQPTKKDDKDSRDNKKNKSFQNSLANALLSGTQSSLAQLKKDQDSHSCQKRPWQQRQGQNIPATDVNATAIRKNKNIDKDKKDLSNIKYYTCKQ